MTCALNTANLQTEDHTETIFYSTHDIIIYRHINRVRLALISGEILSEAKASVDNTNYEFISLDDAILFIFNGVDLILLDKTSDKPEQYQLDHKIGRNLTRLYPGDDSDRIIFGTKNANRIQFINYDFMQKRRIAQTASWEVSKITDMIVTSDMILFAVLDQSTIISCDMKTGETLWTKFETSTINRGIVCHNGELIYSCQGLLKKARAEGIEVMRIPVISVTSVEHEDDLNIYVTSNNNKNLCCYHTPSKKIKWELRGRHPIHESVLAKNQQDEPLLLTRTDDYIGVINLSTAVSESSIRTKNILRLRTTEDHILIQKSTPGTILIPGVKNVHKN